MKKRVPSKHPIVNGIITYPDGREVCQTDAAWNRRKREIFDRYKGMCQIAPLIGRQSHAIRLSDSWTADHIKKRGMGGATRDDRKENLRLGCEWCHTKAHDMNVHGKDIDND